MKISVGTGFLNPNHLYISVPVPVASAYTENIIDNKFES